MPIMATPKGFILLLGNSHMKPTDNEARESVQEIDCFLYLNCRNKKQKEKGNAQKGNTPQVVNKSASSTLHVQ